MQLGIAAGQPQRIAVGQRLAGQRREEDQPGAERTQRVEVGRVDEREGRVARDGDGAAREQRRDRGDLIGGRWLEAHLRQLQRPQRRAGQRLGHAVEPLGRVAELVRRHQAQVAFGQREARVARQGAEPVRGLAQGAAQHVGMALAGHAIGQHAGPGHAGPEALQPMRQRAEGAGHRLGVDHGQHRQAEALRQVGRARRAVEQAHHALDDHEVGLGRGRMQPRAAVGLAGHPQVERMHGRAGGEPQPVRVEEVGPALEGAHAPALARMQPRERGGHGGLALTGGGRGHEHGGAARRAIGQVLAYWGVHFNPTYALRPPVT